MNFNDDDEIVLDPAVSGPPPIVSDDRVKLVFSNNPVAPLEEYNLKLTLELTGKDKSRSPLDLVAVLDVSDSMNREGKLEKMKKAMLFAIQKLDIVDQLSIVKYSNKARKLCPLRQMTGNSRTEIEKLITDLDASGGTNTTDGLQTALKILNEREFSQGRVGAIMLMSDGAQNRGGDAAQVHVGDLAVHTFGFGDDQDAKVLNAIANNSLGGVYSEVRLDNLNKAFSQCLGGLLSVVAQDLTVTLTPGESTIQQVSAGTYKKTLDNGDGSVKIRFGDLYMEEGRKVLVELLLPDITNESGVITTKERVLEVTLAYKFKGQLCAGAATPKKLFVRRKANLTDDERQTPPEVRDEELRLQIADVIKQATGDADRTDLEAARQTLAISIQALGRGGRSQLKAALSAELEELHKLMQTQSIYNSQGRPCAYSFLTSHNTQRQAARGNDIGKFQLFATPAMRKFVEEAQKYEDIDDLKDYMELVINALKSVAIIIDNAA